MIEEADFQKVGNAAIDLCVFVDKLRLGEKHREEADKLTHNVLELIKTTKKIKGYKMSKKLKIQFWKAKQALAMQILEQEGLPKSRSDGVVNINNFPWLDKGGIDLRGDNSKNDWVISTLTFKSNDERDACLERVVNAITDELFTGEGELKVGEMCEVRDDEDEQWKEKKLITILPAQYEGRFIAEWGDCPSKHSHWNYARPLSKRTEPTAEECGQLVTYTWEEK